MPLNLCHCDKQKLNRLNDQVTALSTAVDELRQEVNSLKIRFFDRSKNDGNTANYCKIELSQIGTNTYEKLKKYLEKNVMPVISTDTASCVKKKCKEYLTKSTRTLVPCQGRAPPRRSSNCQNSESVPLPERNFCVHMNCCETSKCCVRKSAKWTTKKMLIPRKGNRKAFCRESKKTRTVSTMTRNLKDRRHKRSNKARFSHDYYASRSSGQAELVTGREETTSGDCSNSTLPASCYSTDEFAAGPDQRAKYPQHTNFVNATQKRIAVESRGTSTSYCTLTSNTSVDRFQGCEIFNTEAGGDVNKRKALKRRRMRKTSKCTQCFPDRVYIMVPKLFQRDASANTFIQGGATNSVYMEIVRKVNARRNKDTQTCLRYDEIFKDVCMYGERRKYEPTASAWLHEKGSILPKSSHSPTSISAPFAGSEKLDEELLLKRLIDATKEGENSTEKEQIDATEEAEGKTTDIKTETALVDNSIKDGQERTYIISPAVSFSQNEATSDCKYFCEKTRDFSSNVENRWPNNQSFTVTSCEEVLKKKPEIPTNIFQNNDYRKWVRHSDPNDCEDLVKTVCVYRPRSRYLTKLFPWTANKCKSPPISNKSES